MGEARGCSRQTLTHHLSQNMASMCPSRGYSFSVTSRLLILSLLATGTSREPDGGRKYEVMFIGISGWALVPHTSQEPPADQLSHRFAAALGVGPPTVSVVPPARPFCR